MSKQVKTINPATEQVLREYTLMSTKQANKAVEDAHECFNKWRLRSFEDKAKLLNTLADLIEQQSDELSQLMTDEMGKVKEQGAQEVALCAEICRYTATHGPKLLADEERDFEQGKAIVTYQPIGVVLGIQPWNFPLYQVIRYSVTNIMAGNTTVLKHAANVFGMAQRIQTLFEQAGFPKHCFQALLIDGDMASKLIEHDLIRGVTFTGSDEVGKNVAEIAASQTKKTVLELGSNDAYIILDDADLAIAVKACVMGRTINNGETCVAAKRFIVTDKNYEQFKKLFVEAMDALKLGDPNDKNTDLGPMARENLRDELHEQVQRSINKGAKVLLGCEIPKRTGFYYPASVLENVRKGMPAYDDELFGPVASLIRVSSDEEAMRAANDSRYGLGGGIFSKDAKAATELAIKEFHTGMVNINGFGLAHPNLPFGGVKSSGYGREHGGFGIREFVNVKSIMIST